MLCQWVAKGLMEATLEQNPITKAQMDCQGMLIAFTLTNRQNKGWQSKSTSATLNNPAAAHSFLIRIHLLKRCSSACLCHGMSVHHTPVLPTCISYICLDLRIKGWYDLRICRKTWQSNDIFTIWLTATLTVRDLIFKHATNSKNESNNISQGSVFHRKHV